MSSDPGYYALMIELPDNGVSETVSLVADFNASIIAGGDFVFLDGPGPAVGNAIFSVLSMRASPNTSGAAVGYVLGSTPVISGMLTPGGPYAETINVMVLDPVTGNMDLAGTLPPGTAGPVSINWTAPADGSILPRTRGEIRTCMHERRKARQQRT